MEFPVDKIEAICRRYRVRELSVFGWAARGELGPQSGVDFLVVFKSKAEIGLFKLSRLARELSSVVGRQVDLVPKGGLKPVIRDRVLAEAKVVWEE